VAFKRAVTMAPLSPCFDLLASCTRVSLISGCPLALNVFGNGLCRAALVPALRDGEESKWVNAALLPDLSLKPS
jgi:hypothetical protein